MPAGGEDECMLMVSERGVLGEQVVIVPDIRSSVWSYCKIHT